MILLQGEAHQRQSSGVRESAGRGGGGPQLWARGDRTVRGDGDGPQGRGRGAGRAAAGAHGLGLGPPRGERVGAGPRPSVGA